MRNFYRQGPPPTRSYHQHQYYGPAPGRMPNYGFPPPRGYNPGMIPPTGPKGASKIESFMDTCNRFLATAQGFQPYIAQATPLLRNLPALWRLYKGFSSTPKGDEDDDYESSQFSLESSEFEYIYKEDDHDHEQDSKRESRNTERHHRNRPLHKHEHNEAFNHHRGANRFSPVKHERRREKEPEKIVKKITKPQKTKPSVPKIFQPTYHFDE